MHSRHSSINNLRWAQQRKILEPQARRFDFAVPILPRLDHLVRLSDARGNDRDWVLQRDLRHRRIEQKPNERERLGLLLLLQMKPTCTRNGEMRARRMGHHQIPALAQQRHYVPLDVVGRVRIAGQQVTGPSIVTGSAESVSHPARVFAGN